MDVGSGIVVAVGVVVIGKRVFVGGVDSIAGLLLQLMKSKTKIQIEKIRLNKSPISNYQSPINFTSPLAAG